MNKVQIVNELTKMGISDVLTSEGKWPRKGQMMIVNVPNYKLEILGVNWKNHEALVVVGLGNGQYKLGKTVLGIKSNPADRYISIIRTFNNDSSQSTLVMEKGRLVVMGNLPHNASISFDEKNALKLYRWLRDTYMVYDK